MQLLKKEKRWLILGRFTESLIEYEKLHEKYISLLLRLTNIRPTSDYLYIDTKDRKRILVKRDNFELIEKLMKDIENILSRLEDIDTNILLSSKEYKFEFKEMIPIESIRLKNKTIEEELKKKLEVLIDGKEYC